MPAGLCFLNKTYILSIQGETRYFIGKPYNLEQTKTKPDKMKRSQNYTNAHLTQ
jgi:hypothetical protein